MIRVKFEIIGNLRANINSLAFDKVLEERTSTEEWYSGDNLSNELVLEFPIEIRDQLRVHPKLSLVAENKREIFPIGYTSVEVSDNLIKYHFELSKENRQIINEGRLAVKILLVSTQITWSKHIATIMVNIKKGTWASDNVLYYGEHAVEDFRQIATNLELDQDVVKHRVGDLEKKTRAVTASDTSWELEQDNINILGYVDINADFCVDCDGVATYVMKDESLLALDDIPKQVVNQGYVQSTIDNTKAITRDASATTITDGDVNLYGYLTLGRNGVSIDEDGIAFYQMKDVANNTQSEIANISYVVAKFEEIVGLLNNLTTTEKKTIVGALNELKAYDEKVNRNIGFASNYTIIRDPRAIPTYTPRIMSELTTKWYVDEEIKKSRNYADVEVAKVSTALANHETEVSYLHEDVKQFLGLTDPKSQNITHTLAKIIEILNDDEDNNPSTSIKRLIELINERVAYVDVVDNLVSSLTNKPLSALQGNVLNSKIGNLRSSIEENMFVAEVSPVDEEGNVIIDDEGCVYIDFKLPIRDIDYNAETGVATLIFETRTQV